MKLAPASRSDSAPTGASVAIEARGLTKRFGSMLANDRIDIAFRHGEIHALLGENGAGKSTLVKLLYGYQQPDAGEILVEGRPVSLKTPRDARALGIGMVFQQFTLIPAFTVAENIALYLPDLSRVLHMDALDERIGEVSARYGMQIDPSARVGTLSVGEQQRIEVLRILLAGARILFFDEPTSVLAAHEIDGLFEIFRKLASDGYPVVFITHKLAEVLECADQVTVMRHGTIVGTVDARTTDDRALVEMMFGAIPEGTQARGAGTGDTILELLDLRTAGTGSSALHGLDLQVRAGEIVGVAGVSGNGQQELGDAILGTLPISGGTKRLFGQDASRWNVHETREHRVAFVPEAPIAMTLIGGMTIEENLALSRLSRYERRRGFGIDWKQVRSDATATASRLGMEIPELWKRVGMLSGGQVQRFAVARELAHAPKLLVALYPTKGLDVPTANVVHGLLARARADGAGILLISQDLSELLAISDRIVVLRGGRIVGEMAPDAVDRYEIGRLMTGSDAS